MFTTQHRDLIARDLESENMDLAAFVPAFYQRFFTICPDLRDLFPEDLAAQEAKLLASLTHLAEALEESDRLEALLATLGRQHKKMTVSDAHFDGFISSFTSAMEQTLGSDWGPKSQDAWSAFLAHVAQKMNFLTFQKPADA